MGKIMVTEIRTTAAIANGGTISIGSNAGRVDPETLLSEPDVRIRAPEG